MARRKGKSTGKQKKEQQLTTEQEKSVTSLLQRLSRSGPAEIAAQIPDAQTAKALIERLPLDKEILLHLLPAVSEKFQDKDTQKAVKRILFRLKGKGVSLEPFEKNDKDSVPVLKPLPREEPLALVGPVLDLYGAQGVFLIIDRRGPGKYVAVGVASNEMGIQEFVFGAYGKKELKKIKEDFSRAAGPLVEAPPPYVASILETAYNCHSEGDTELPSDYLEFRPMLLKTVPSPDRKVIYKALPDLSENGEAAPTQSQLTRLFGNPIMDVWLIDYESIKIYMKEMDGVKESPLVLSGAQKEERLANIKNRCTEELFPPEKRLLIKYRLEEMAYFFLKEGDEGFSRLALLAAASMDREDSLLVKNPVVDFLVDKSLRFYLEGGKQRSEEEGVREDSSGLILP